LINHPTAGAANPGHVKHYSIFKERKDVICTSLYLLVFWVYHKSYFQFLSGATATSYVPQHIALCYSGRRPVNYSHLLFRLTSVLFFRILAHGVQYFCCFPGFLTNSKGCLHFSQILFSFMFIYPCPKRVDVLKDRLRLFQSKTEPVFLIRFPVYPRQYRERRVSLIFSFLVSIWHN
jgi:hypothetical protein